MAKLRLMQSRQQSLEQCGHRVGLAALQQQIWQASRSQRWFRCCNRMRGDLSGSCQLCIVVREEWMNRSSVNKREGGNQKILIMSSYKHCYSEYISHILNKSPSKTAYSFSRTERFPVKQVQNVPTQSEPCIHSNNHNYHPSRTSPYRHITHSQAQSPSHNEYFHRTNTDQAVRRELQRILRKIQSGGQRRSQSKSNSPLRRSRDVSPNSPKRKGAYGDLESRSPSGKQNRPSPLKNYWQQLRQMDHPSQNMTTIGYYPVGTELSPTGRYASSRIPNVVGAKFRASPPRNSNREKQAEMGPGKYNVFSQFGS